MPNDKSTTAAPTQEDISRRAYALWQDAGSPPNASQDHWLQAERELSGPRSGAPNALDALTASTTPYSASGSSSVSGQGASAAGSGSSGGGRR